MIPSWANDYLGIPFKRGGRDRTGLDCFGIYRLAALEHFNVQLPTFLEPFTTKYEQTELRALIEHRMPDLGRTVARGAERCGDIIFLRPRGVLHVGMVLGDGKMLTVEEKAGSVVDRYQTRYWEHRIEGFYRFKQL